MDKEFSWTREYKRSWEENTESKKIDFSISSRKFTENKKSIIRHLLVCIDTSASIEKSDYIPTIRGAISETLPEFSKNFRNSNPLSSLNFLTCKDVFEKYSTEFDSGSLLSLIGSDQFSFLNCVKSGIEFLRNSSYNKEILIITSSIGTRDSGDYDQVINDVKKSGMKISVISICGEVSLFKKMTQISNGLFYVPVDRHHFEIILNYFIEPLECLESTSSLIKLGFPQPILEPGVCTCHLQFHKTLLECPICKTSVCSLPCQCPICSIQLVSPINISKSYYFMYPLKPFECDPSGLCKKCSNASSNKCPDCSSFYCEECYLFLERDLNFCIYCTK
jgi:transcription initiation factor TFIIH subunit 2